MKKIGILYVIIGVIAVIGAVLAALVVFSLGEALGVINSGGLEGTDAAQLQSYAGTLSTLIAAGWVWVISVFLSGLISIYFGVLNLRSRTKPELRR